MFNSEDEGALWHAEFLTQMMDNKYLGECVNTVLSISATLFRNDPMKVKNFLLKGPQLAVVYLPYGYRGTRPYLPDSFQPGNTALCPLPSLDIFALGASFEDILETYGPDFPIGERLKLLRRKLQGLISSMQIYPQSSEN